MISRETLDRAIAEHESGDTSYANCERLAWLYIVRDHLPGEAQKEPTKKEKEATSSPGGDSDFLKAIHGKDMEKAISVMDEIMQAIQVLQPKLYNAAIDRLKDL